MYVLTATDERAGQLREVCDPIGIDVTVDPPDTDASLDDLLAVFYDLDGAVPVPVQRARQHGAYTVLLVPAPVDGESVLAATRSGYSFVLTRPLRVERVRALLHYLSTVAAPREVKQLTLHDDLLRTSTRSVTLTAPEAAALRVFADYADRIVSREQLTAACGDTPLREMLTQLRTHLEQVGSGAQILNVPHMGFRLAGHVTVRG